MTRGGENDEQHDAYDPDFDDEAGPQQVCLASFAMAFCSMELLWKHEDGARLMERPAEGGASWNLGHRYKLWLESQGRVGGGPDVGPGDFLSFGVVAFTPLSTIPLGGT